MKLTLSLLSALCFSTVASAQVLYNNAWGAGLTGEGLRTADRPGGGSYSEVPYRNMITGFRGSITGADTDRLADDFRIYTGRWSVNQASLFMYQTDSTELSIVGGLFEIRKKVAGRPGDLMGTGSFGSVEWTDIYRHFNNQRDDRRRVQKVNVNFSVTLDEGEYFLVWATVGKRPWTGPWNPYLTKAGFSSYPGANALQSTNGGGSWYNIQDGTVNQGLPFVLQGVSYDANGGRIAPEPATWVALAAGLAVMARRRRR